MAEIIGVAASATQLVAMCVSLLDLIKKIKGVSSTLKKYHQQLNELRSVSESISTNPLLQTPEVGSHTQTLLAIIDDNSLSYLLRKGRFFRTLGLLHKERDLLDAFSSLERHKTNLSLLIEDIQARALHQIQSDIKFIVNMSSSHATASLDLEIAGNEIDLPPLHSKTTSMVLHDPSRNQQTSGDTQGMPVTRSRPISSAMPNNTQQPRESQQSSYQTQKKPTQKNWERCDAARDVSQTNGFLLAGTSKIPKMEPVFFPGSFNFKDCQKQGSGTQVNGVEIKNSDDEKPVAFPDFNGTWSNCHSRGNGGPDGTEIEGEVLQVNGVYYRSVEKEDDDLTG
ncbi:hypothetical protein BKA56DRAFT_104847 [Ilyonectria sp. MPI-CAGE-AT-0026]|nr:hypothetical protein BKA56DRAFT_104847 [Ilyonectria sp. MPI-CAGE-AT-0026]